MKNNNNNNKITLAVVIAAVAILTAQVTALWAQPSINTPEAQRILDISKDNCELLTSSPLNCISLLHESPTTVVLAGDLFLTGTGISTANNIVIWPAVDGFKALGYSIDSVEQTGQGTEDNPLRLMIVMSK
jgi:hypothetical protein